MTILQGKNFYRISSVVDTNYSIIPFDQNGNLLTNIWIQTDTTTAPLTIDLPDLSTLAGQYNIRINVVDIAGSAASNNVTITASGSDVIDSSGNTSVALANNESSIFIIGVSDSQWSSLESFQAVSPSPIVVAGTGTLSTLRCGVTNTASAFYTTVFGRCNNASGTGSTISGGGRNTASGSVSFIGGGNQNSATGSGAVISAGSCNISSNGSSTVVGGVRNTASGFCSFIGGGVENTASGNRSTIGGGSQNIAACSGATVAGGNSNLVQNNNSFIGGGSANRVDSCNSTISGGVLNTILTTSDCSFIGGGNTNAILTTSKNSVIGGGNQNQIFGCNSTISGGYINRVCASNSSILSGSANIVMDSNSSINGGMLNAIGCVTISNTSSFAGCVSVPGDQTSQFSIGNYFAYYHDIDNRVYAGTITCSTYNGFQTELIGINPGFSDSFQGQGINFSTATSSSIYGNSTIGGGYGNIIEGIRNTISGGYYNRASGIQSTISGGVFNSSNNNSFIGGGICNTASASSSTASGGSNNTSSGVGSFVGGGLRNLASGSSATISGGQCNTSSGAYSGILGGKCNTASCACSFVAGFGITTDRPGTLFANNLSLKNLPTASVGLPSGSVWRNGTFLEIVP